MATVTEQLSAVTRTNLESQVALMTAVSNKMFEGMQKLIDLNLQAVRTSLDESNEAMRQIMSVRDTRDLITISSQQAQPTLEKAISYGRHVASIATTTQAEVTKAAEEQIAESNRKVIGLVEQVTQNAPSGSENVISLVKSALNSANSTVEQLSKSTRQAADAMQANLNNAVNQFANSAASANDAVQNTAQQAVSSANNTVIQAAGATRTEKQR